ncbi:MAG TPA: hypothetical protein VGD65_23035 [Chryseosolibacter sp.]
MNSFKSMGVILLGFMVNALLSIITDFLLESVGILPDPSRGLFETWAIILVLFYRSGYAILAGFVVARLAPDRAVPHVLILGVIGTVITILAVSNPAFAGKAPLWFGYTLAFLTIPMLWLGAKIQVSQGVGKSL